jgi:hypothetical protein
VQYSITEIFTDVNVIIIMSEIQSRRSGVELEAGPPGLGGGGWARILYRSAFFYHRLITANEFTSAGLFNLDDHAANITAINFTGFCHREHLLS